LTFSKAEGAENLIMTRNNNWWRRAKIAN
jgi:hypothetical protein